MGIGLGFGLLLGVRAAATGALTFLLTSVISIALLALLSPRGPRSVLLCLAVGLCTGWAIAGLRMDQTSAQVPVRPQLPLEAQVVSDPRITPSGYRAVIRWSDGSEHLRESLVFLPAGSSAARGDQVTVHGRVSADPVNAVIFATSAVVNHRSDWLETQRRAIRDHASLTMVTHVPGSAGSLTLGLLIGDDTRLSRAERQELRASGLAHVTAVSGWNVSVIVAMVAAVFRAIGARGWFWLIVQLLLVAGYVWIVGLEPPIQRAAIMGAVALIALQFGRPAHLLTLLILTAGLMTMWNPGLLGSLSFWLSFLSMLGLVVSTRVTVMMDGWKTVIVAPAVTAAAAGIATAPLLAATFGTLALMTMPANVLAGPLIPFATVTGMVVVALSWISPLADIAGWVTWAFAALVLTISRLFAGFPGGHHTFAPITSSALVAIYAALVLLAAPVIPEGRAVARRLEDWSRRSPQTAALSIICALVALLAGVLSVS